MFQKIRSLFGTEKKSAGSGGVYRISELPALLRYGANGQHINARQAMEIYRNSAAVATAVDLISDEYMQITPVLKNRKTNEFVNDHPFLEKLSDPNPSHDYARFINDIGHHYHLDGNCYIGLVGNTEAPPVHIWPVDPQEVSDVDNNVDRYSTGYYVTQSPASGVYRRQGDKMWRYIDGAFKELIPITGYSSYTSKSEGDSPLQAAALEARQLIESRNHNLRLLTNGGRLSMAVVFKDMQNLTTEEQYNERVEKVNRQFAGSDNAGRIAVFASEDMDFREMGQTNKDMDYQSMEEISKEAIFLRYKIPLPLVSTDASTFNNFSNAVVQFYDRTVLPSLGIILSGLAKVSLPRYGLNPSEWELTYNPEAIPALMSRRIEELQARKNIGIETINELRTLVPNREPIEGGDTLYQPVSNVPIGTGELIDPVPMDMNDE